ncbi:MAG: hypothetical protein AVDCRST_MAG59-418, partial [uncultured Thermomicrobiales bacterium]
ARVGFDDDEQGPGYDPGRDSASSWDGAHGQGGVCPDGRRPRESAAGAVHAGVGHWFGATTGGPGSGRFRGLDRRGDGRGGRTHRAWHGGV